MILINSSVKTFKSMTKLFFTREELWKYGNQLVWDPAKVSPGHKSRWYLSLTILRTRIPLKPLQKNFFLVDRSLFTFRWTDWKFRTLLVWSNLVASGPIPLLFPTEIIWELPLHTAAITSSRGSSPHLTTKPSINKRPTLEQSLFLLGWQLN